MSNENVAPEVQSDVRQAPQQLTEVQIVELKHKLFERFRQLYHEFIAKIQNIPVDPACLPVAYQYFDSAYLWIEKGIKNAVFQAIVTPQAPADPSQQNAA